MRTVMHLAPDLGPNSYAHQLAILLPRLPRDRVRSNALVFRDQSFFRDPLEAAAISIDVLGRQKSFAPALWWAMRRAMGQRRPDLIHAWGWAALRLAASATIGRKIPIVAFDTATSVRTSRIDRWLLNRAAHVVLPADSLPSSAAGPFIVDRKCVIRFAVEKPSTPCRITAKERLGLPGDAPVFVFAGRLAPRHGWRESLMVFDILSHVYQETWLIVVGDGHERAAMDEFVFKLGLDRVRLLGWRRDLPEVLAASDALFCFGEIGGRSMSLQALAAGTPVLAWRRGDLLDLLGDAAVFCERNDRHATAIAARQIVENQSHREELIRRGLARVVSFNPENVARQWLELYERVVQ